MIFLHQTSVHWDPEENAEFDYEHQEADWDRKPPAEKKRVYEKKAIIVVTDPDVLYALN